ncbi:MAG: hypothetical protein AAFX95_03830 [Cyanobacteria bacterium J06639_16]
MKKFSLIQLALVASVLGAIAPASWAQSDPVTEHLLPQTTAGLANPMPTAPTSPVTLGTDTALVVQFPIALTLTIDEGQPYPISLPLVQAILDHQGNVIVPAQTPVAIQLRPQDGGVQLVAESLVVNGQLIPIVASGSVIPGITVTYEDANAMASESSAVFSSLFANTAGLLTNGNPNSYTQGGMLGSIVGTIAGLQSAETARVVQIPKDATYVLSLTTPVTF